MVDVDGESVHEGLSAYCWMIAEKVISMEGITWCLFVLYFRYIFFLTQPTLPASDRSFNEA